MRFAVRRLTDCVLITIICVVLANNATLSDKEQKKYKNLIEGQGLFSRDDDVEILTVDNFKHEVFGHNHAWIIEFYNSWCGFCQRFAPSWKALASDLRGWKDLIRVGAIDCTNPDNTPLCRDFEIMSYPTLRYFHENYQEGPKNLGVTIAKGDDMDGHRRNLINQIITEQREGRGKIFPNLIPYTYPNLNHLYDSVPPGTKFVFIIFEKEGMSAGPEVAVDLHTVPKIVVRYTYHNNTEIIKYLSIKKLPFMAVVTDERQSQQFAQGLKTRESLRMAIKEFLKPKDIIIPDQESNEKLFTGKWIEAEVPDISSLMEAREKVALREKVKKMGDVVFQMDLEAALRRSLKNEVSITKTISDEKLQALIKYLDVLIKYFPFGIEGQEFLVRLKNKVLSSGSSIEGETVANFIKAEESGNHKIFSSPDQFLACEGSKQQYRGYPCSLWKMFHFLTISAADKNIGNTNADPLEVLSAMEGYIRNFFGCADCAQHFLEMVKKKDMRSVKSLESAVIWLWMAHNAANKRLAGDETEDPQAPKIQFPSAANCPHCRNPDGTWNLPYVLGYLKHMYSNINVRYIGSDTSVIHSGLESGSDNSTFGIFGGLDTSTFILSMFTFLILLYLLRIFCKRRCYRKKMYMHDLLGKV